MEQQARRTRGSSRGGWSPGRRQRRQAHLAAARRPGAPLNRCSPPRRCMLPPDRYCVLPPLSRVREALLSSCCTRQLLLLLLRAWGRGCNPWSLPRGCPVAWPQCVSASMLACSGRECLEQKGWPTEQTRADGQAGTRSPAHSVLQCVLVPERGSLGWGRRWRGRPERTGRAQHARQQRHLEPRGWALSCPRGQAAEAGFHCQAPQGRRPGRRAGASPTWLHSPCRPCRPAAASRAQSADLGGRSGGQAAREAGARPAGPTSAEGDTVQPARARCAGPQVGLRLRRGLREWAVQRGGPGGGKGAGAVPPAPPCRPADAPRRPAAWQAPCCAWACPSLASCSLACWRA